jgi:hypothetical protein
LPLPSIAVAAVALPSFPHGPGVGITHHGNQGYRWQVFVRWPRYRQAQNNAERTQVVLEIADWVHHQGGRFLIRDPQQRTQRLANAEEIMAKISAALRDAHRRNPPAVAPVGFAAAGGDGDGGGGAAAAAVVVAVPPLPHLAALAQPPMLADDPVPEHLDDISILDHDEAGDDADWDLV